MLSNVAASPTFTVRLVACAFTLSSAWIFATVAGCHLAAHCTCGVISRGGAAGPVDVEGAAGADAEGAGGAAGSSSDAGASVGADDCVCGDMLRNHAGSSDWS